MAGKERKKRKLTIPTLAVAAVAAFLIVKGIMQQPKIVENKEKIDDLNEQIVQQEKKIDDLDELAANVDSDEYIEKVAREKLGLIKENEIMFIDVAGK